MRKNKNILTLLLLTLIVSSLIPLSVSAKAGRITPFAAACTNCGYGTIITSNTYTPWVPTGEEDNCHCDRVDAFQYKHIYQTKEKSVIKNCNNCGSIIDKYKVVEESYIHVRK